METIKTYCIECDRDVEAPIVDIDDRLTIKGEEVLFKASVAKCPHCESLIGDATLESKNLDTAYKQYCIEHGLMTKEEICELRRRTKLSLREFSKFLGFGEQTAAKYEKGAIPDLLHSNTMKMAATPAGAKMLLDLNGAELRGESAALVADYIDKMVSGDISYEFIMLSSEEDSEPSINNGYRVYSPLRAAALVACLAQRCDHFVKTKVQKAAFFCDNLCFERTGKSLTGMTYVHADFGPIMPDYNFKLKNMEEQGFIVQVEDGWGVVIAPGSRALDLFTEDEHEMIDLTVDFVNAFTSAKELSEYSHNLDAWKNTASGRIISYGANHGEVTRAIEQKLENVN